MYFMNSWSRAKSNLASDWLSLYRNAFLEDSWQIMVESKHVTHIWSENESVWNNEKILLNASFAFGMQLSNNANDNFLLIKENLMNKIRILGQKRKTKELSLCTWIFVSWLVDIIRSEGQASCAFNDGFFMRADLRNSWMKFMLIRRKKFLQRKLKHGVLCELFSFHWKLFWIIFFWKRRVNCNENLT